MGSRDQPIEIDFFERRLLSGDSDSISNDHTEADEDAVLYSASFEDMEENFVKYQIAQWIFYSVLLILAWGIGVFMLLYLPVRRYILRMDFRSRKLFLTPNAIVYKVTRPVPFPCCGVLKTEKHILLTSVTDVVIEQGYLQSFFGIYSIRIENAGIRRPASYNVHIQGVADPCDFRKAVLTRLSSIRSWNSSQQTSVNEDTQTYGSGPFAGAWIPSHGDLILQKLEEVGSSVKKVQALIERQPLKHVN